MAFEGSNATPQPLSQCASDLETSLATIIATHRPGVLRAAARHWTTLAKAHIADLKAESVDVSVSVSTKFSGSVLDSESMHMPLSKLLDGGESREGQAEPGLHYYLCQCTIASSEGAVDLKGLEHTFTLPRSVEKGAFLEANVWMNTSEVVKTNLHFDANDNLLAVVEGCKRVSLFAPDQVPYLYMQPVYSQSSNHSAVDVFNPDFDAHPDFAKATCEEVCLRPNDVLFIPEGWFHAVQSEPHTLALNIWFKGLRTKISGPHVPASSYYARSLLKELQDREVKAMRAHGKEFALELLDSLPAPLGATLRKHCSITMEEEVKAAEAETFAEAMSRPTSAVEAMGIALITGDASACDAELREVLDTVPLSTATTNSLLRVLPIPAMAKVVASVHAAAPDAWLKAALALDSVTADIWTHRMEACDASAHDWLQPFYAKVFHGVAAEAVRRHLVQAKEDNARLALTRVMETHFGYYGR